LGEDKVRETKGRKNENLNIDREEARFHRDHIEMEMEMVVEMVVR
jgi:hypothetical protein